MGYNAAALIGSLVSDGARNCCCIDRGARVRKILEIC
jgi:hypothetical protein